MKRKAKKYRPRVVPKHERKRKKRASHKTTTALTTRFQAPTVPEAIEKVLIGGDLNPLLPEQRIEYMKAVCKSLGLNPLTQPFAYILFKETENAPSKLVLYARKDCAEQLRKIHGVSVLPGFTKRTIDDDFATVEVSVRDRWGKTDTATGMVYLWKKWEGKQYRLSGQRLADAILKAETKAKRRATLSVCGLGILDEHDLDSLRVVGGVTPEGRTFEYNDPPPAKIDQGESQDEEEARMLAKDKEAFESIKAQGLWCEEHSRIRNTSHLKECESSRKALEALKRQKMGQQPETQKSSHIESPERQHPSQGVAGAAKTGHASPSGRKDDAQVAPGRSPSESPASVPQLTLDWQVSETSPRLTGDSDIIEKLKGDIHASWENEGEAGSFWHVQVRDAEALRRGQDTYGYRLVEILPKADSSSGAKAPRGTTPSPGGDKHGKRSGSSGERASSPGQSAPAVEWMTGIVDQVNPGSGKSPSLNLLFAVEPKKKFWLGCFDQALFPFLSKAAGINCQFVVQKRKSGDKTYTNIIGIKRIGNTAFEDDGKTPCLSVNREPGKQGTIWP